MLILFQLPKIQCQKANLSEDSVLGFNAEAKNALDSETKLYNNSEITFLFLFKITCNILFILLYIYRNLTLL